MSFPTITRKIVYALDLTDFMGLVRSLQALRDYHSDGMTPADRERLSVARNHCHKRRAQLRKGFFKNMAYKGPRYPKVRGGLPCGTLWNTTSYHMGRRMDYDAIAEAYRKCPKHGAH